MIYSRKQSVSVVVWFACAHRHASLAICDAAVIPMMTDVSSVQALLRESLENVEDVEAMSNLIISQLKEVSCKTAIRLAERAITAAKREPHFSEKSKAAQQLSALESILQDYAGDEALALRVCSV